MAAQARRHWWSGWQTMRCRGVGSWSCSHASPRGTTPTAHSTPPQRRRWRKRQGASHGHRCDALLVASMASGSELYTRRNPRLALAGRGGGGCCERQQRGHQHRAAGAGAPAARVAAGLGATRVQRHAARTARLADRLLCEVRLRGRAAWDIRCAVWGSSGPAAHGMLHTAPRPCCALQACAHAGAGGARRGRHCCGAGKRVRAAGASPCGQCGGGWRRCCSWAAVCSAI